MKLKLEIVMDNAAFSDDPQGEPGRILRHAAEVIERGNLGMEAGAKMPLRDLNGNRVGEVKVTR